MSDLPPFATDWRAARRSIADAYLEASTAGETDANRVADAILARLTHLDPPLLVVRADDLDERDRLRAVFVDGAHGQMGGLELVAGIYEFPLAPGLSTRFGYCPVCQMVWPPDGTHECQATREDT